LRILCDGCDTVVKDEFITPFEGNVQQLGRASSLGLCPNCVSRVSGFIDNIRREKTIERLDANGKE